VLIVYDDVFTEHLRDVAHPESPDRVARVAEHLAAVGLLGERIGSRVASDAELTRVHPRAYLERVQRDIESLGSRRAGYLSTGDTVIDHTSLDVARRAAGGAVAAMECAVAERRAAFALVRPPGHHAEPSRGMGFCIFNNVAVVARAFAAESGKRVLVVDFDYHHGNGTQAAAGDGFSFVSTHAYPQYPGTGSAAENVLRADGAIVNIPLPPDVYGTEAFVATWQRALPEVARRVRPDLLVVSAGYDFAAGDPVGDLGIDGPLAARELGALIRAVAGEYTEGRVVYCLEGGYDPATLARCVEATVRAHSDEAQGASADAAAIPQAQRVVLERVSAWQS
jgi:acetoin utilization deacetylase AcuC-like enzyme